ncbi:Wiskott-Aldrich syndrome protein family member 3 [Nymphon striatum]|nr:Wiskott-Aldrich syndrome protein family member 3 [Nymphon striatum]KAG1676267.1 Wiskott-Aldrich syndrome protein family member 3 [Nymphon striatum]
MPILQRLIEPVHVSRGTLPVEVQNELECVTNGTLSNIIRQLSSLSKHAEDIFNVLCRDSASVQARMNSMKGRIDRLAVKVTQLDSNVEEVSLQDIHMRKAFKSSIVYEQQVVSRDTLPTAMAETYQMCDRPPPLEKLNPYRDDGKNGLKFYTDPNYFFDLWRHDQLMETEKMLQGRVKKPHRPKQDGKRQKKVRAPQNSKEKYKQIASTNDIIDHYGPGHALHPHQQAQMRQHEYYPESDAYTHQRPNSLEIQNSYIQEQEEVVPSEPYPPPPYTEQAVYPQQNPPPYTYSQDTYANSPQNSGTPTSRTIRSTSTARPSQPPPAPPQGLGSGGSSNSTPTPTPPMGTPTNGARVRATSHSRDNLPPPPPPPPEAMVNGGIPLHPQYQAMKGQTPVGSPAHNHVPSAHNSQHSTPSHMSNHVPGSREHTPAPNLPNLEHNATPDSIDLPPPPPTPDLKSLNNHDDHSLPPPSPPPPMNAVPSNGVPAPPPPPPPPSMMQNGVINNRIGTSELASISSESSTITSSSASKSSESANHERKIKIVTSNSGSTALSDPVDESRSDLLAAIREGIKLKKVEDNKKKEVEKSTTPHDVASILARRVAMEFSDSDSASESEYDSEAWDDETEC